MGYVHVPLGAIHKYRGVRLGDSLCFSGLPPSATRLQMKSKRVHGVASMRVQYALPRVGDGVKCAQTTDTAPLSSASSPPFLAVAIVFRNS